MLWATHGLATGSDLSRFVFFTLRHELSLGTRTLDPVLRVTAWSLNATWIMYMWIQQLDFNRNKTSLHLILSIYIYIY